MTTEPRVGRQFDLRAVGAELGDDPGVPGFAGHRMGMAEIESAMVAHPKVAEAAVVGVPHDIKGQGRASIWDTVMWKHCYRCWKRRVIMMKRGA